MTYIRLNLVVEGQSEEGFVKRILAPHLGKLGIFCSARRIETSRNKRKNIIYRGGLLEYSHLKDDLLDWFKQDQKPEAYFSTMIDLYRLPPEFPGYQEACRYSDPFHKVASIENALGKALNHPKFIPYIQLHEFETLFFSDIGQLCKRYPMHAKAIDELIKCADSFTSPDLIDDGETTAPSKRIIEKIPEYQNEKAFAGLLIAEFIGLDTLRKCLHFNQWLEKLEKLAI